MKKMVLLFSLLVNACQASSPVHFPLPPGDSEHATTLATQVWPSIPALTAPNGLRPCCVFGYNVRAKLLGIPVPFIRLGNVVDPSNTGEHHYNNHWESTLTTLIGMNSEHNGIIYTHRGGFIDLAHVRDTADNTLWLFNQILPRLGHAGTINASDELGQRIIRLWEFPPPERALERYNLAVRLAAHLAFQLAVWHEVAQWYGFESVPGYSEGVSAFSPEDLYSNLLGARMATDILNTGGGASLAQYERAMSQRLPQMLATLQAVTPPQTRYQFDMLDGKWWNSHCRLPDKFLVRHRDYSTDDQRLPSRPADKVPELRLTLPDSFKGQPLTNFARLEIWQGANMANLPSPVLMYGYQDFSLLAKQAETADRHYLIQHDGRCN